MKVVLKYPNKIILRCLLGTMGDNHSYIIKAIFLNCINPNKPAA